MKIVSWNCNGAFRKKYDIINQLNADLYIIQECENPEKYPSDLEFQKFSSNYLWKGDNENKGLCIFAKKSITLNEISHNDIWRTGNLKWFLPVNVNNKFNLIAVWAHNADAKAFDYIGQFWLFFNQNKRLFNKSIICGDFNSNPIWDSWDRWWNHSDCIKELSKLKIESVYHYINSVVPGKEKDKTYFQYKKVDKGYHIDYIFSYKKYLLDTLDFKINNFIDWKEYSDHVPLLWNFKL